LELSVLGTAGWMPADDRETSCYAIKLGSSLLILDAGTGIRRLVGSSAHLLDGITKIDILLSHFHLDHTIGLTYLSAINNNITVWGPGPFYSSTTREILDSITCPPYQPAAISSFCAVKDMDASGVALEDFDIAISRQPLHSAPSVAMRVNEQIVYCTDTAYDTNNIQFARKCRLLLHEAWPSSTTPPEGHSSPAQAATIAAGAGVKELMLVHVPPRADTGQIESEARKIFYRSQVAYDCLNVRV
jgi:ribonuclease BN (tRNA processing enzyme)